MLLGAAALATVLGATAFGAVPQHRVLDRGWDAAAFQRLLRVDTVRALAATAGAIVATLLAVG